MTVAPVLSSMLTYSPPAFVPGSGPTFCTWLPLASSKTVPLRLICVNGMVTVAGVGSGLPAASTAAYVKLTVTAPSFGSTVSLVGS